MEMREEERREREGKMEKGKKEEGEKRDTSIVPVTPRPPVDRHPWKEGTTHALPQQNQHKPADWKLAGRAGNLDDDDNGDDNDDDKTRARQQPQEIFTARVMRQTRRASVSRLAGWGSSAWEGSSSRGRKTPITNPRCLVGYLIAGKASGANPEDKSGVEPRRRLDVDINFLPAAPAAKLVPDVLLYFPLGYISKAERGIAGTGHTRISIYLAQACALERSLQCHCLQYQKQHGRQQIPVISPE
ncbi:hypothetical protein Pcinc_019653 [Petrolisthes cinctipes]|uniref:Uncharacterized protein n=1 Tax=Petrolisthes cinctipes TaxID=88211 RepID=A0AAE1FPG5_PETCI|nr:hypothetical protein Pcinc_019653 [Petrolisthes cinctipes]